MKGTVKLREGSLTVILAVLCCAGASDNLGKRKNTDGGKNCGIGDLS